MFENTIESVPNKSLGDIESKRNTTPTSIHGDRISSNSLPSSPYTAFNPARRRLILAIITIAGFFGPLAGNVYLPALPILAEEYYVGPTVINVTVAVFMVVFAFGPLFWAALADWKGRRLLYIISIAIYIVANILLAVLPVDLGALICLRILQGLGASAVVSLGAGTIADIVEPKGRGRAMSYFLLGPQAAPIFGPIIGGVLADKASWRWIFGFLAISALVLWLVIVAVLPETLPARVGDGSIYAEEGWFLARPESFLLKAPEHKRGPALSRPSLTRYWELFSYPPIGLVSVNTAILYSTYYCVAVQIPSALEQTYHWNTSEVGAGFLAVGIAIIIGSLSIGRLSDWRRSRLKKVVGEESCYPEHRLSDQIWGVLLCATGLVMFGWFIEYSVHPAASLISTFFVGFGMSWVIVTSNAFLTECVVQQAASAFALGNMLRNPAAAVGTVLINPLVDKIGWGWCYTGMALINVIVLGSTLTILRLKSTDWRNKALQS